MCGCSTQQFQTPQAAETMAPGGRRALLGRAPDRSIEDLLPLVDQGLAKSPEVKPLDGITVEAVQ